MTRLTLGEAEFVLLRNFISEHFGIHFDDDKRWMLESKLSGLMSRLPFDSFFGYYNFLMQKFFAQKDYNDSDLIDLVTAITNHETYFRREEWAFDSLFSYARKRREAGKAVRVLCAGCSTGEETYSLAITLMEAGIQPVPDTVVGVDLDIHSLRKAISGKYSRHSFRGLREEELRRVRRHMAQDASSGSVEMWTVSEALRRTVSFHQINLMDANAISRLGRFDVIFCRNVLIYFHPQTRQTALGNLADVLEDGGFLFLGHSENALQYDLPLSVREENNQIYYQKNSMSAPSMDDSLRAFAG